MVHKFRFPHKSERDAGMGQKVENFTGKWSDDLQKFPNDDLGKGTLPKASLRAPLGQGQHMCLAQQY